MGRQALPPVNPTLMPEKEPSPKGACSLGKQLQSLGQNVWGKKTQKENLDTQMMENEADVPRGPACASYPAGLIFKPHNLQPRTLKHRSQLPSQEVAEPGLKPRPVPAHVRFSTKHARRAG